MLFTNISWPARVGTLGLVAALVWPGINNAKFPPWPDVKPRPERTVIVTRACSELGKATIHHYAVRKCRIIMACEDMEDCRATRRQFIVELGNRDLVCRHLDMEDIDSINNFADKIIETEPHIDVLVNNTNYRGRGGKQKITKLGLERHLIHNWIGPYLLTLRLLPKLEESAEFQRDSRIVMHVEKPKKNWPLDLDDLNFERRKYTDDKAYKQSKLAAAYFTLMLDKKLRDQKSKICVLSNGCAIKRYGTIFCDKKQSLWERTVRQFYVSSPTTVTSLSVKLGLDKEIGVKDSGTLYTYIFKCWDSNKGWGRLSENDPLATLAWNHAADLLLKLPQDVNQISSEKSASAVEVTTSARKSQDERQ